MRWYLQFKLAAHDVAEGFMPTVEVASGAILPLLEWKPSALLPPAPSLRMAKVAAHLFAVKSLAKNLSPSNWVSRGALSAEEREYLRIVLDRCSIVDAHKELTDLVEGQRGEI
jgi:hypothetical protein